MKITIRLFAKIREELGVDQFELALDEGEQTIEVIVGLLSDEHGAAWEQCLNAPNTLYAINQQIVEKHQSVKDGDELAFFPPVTGG